MSAGTSAAGTGVIFGIALAFLGQELGYVDFGPLFRALETLVVFALVFAVLFGIVGAGIGRSYRRRAAEREAVKEVAAAKAAEAESVSKP